MSEEATIENGATVYGEDGVELGVVTGSTADGFTVSLNEEVEYVEQEHESNVAGSDAEAGSADDESHEVDPGDHDPGPAFGEGFLMWRCDNCGEMGDLDEGLPDECPNCGSEQVNKWKED